MTIRDWPQSRQILLLSPVLTVVGLVVLTIFPSSTLAVAPIAAAGLVNILSLFMYHSDAKRLRNQDRAAPRWWAWTAAALLFSSTLIAPVYLVVTSR
jgi:hypothetical protein